MPSKFFEGFFLNDNSTLAQICSMGFVKRVSVPLQQFAINYNFILAAQVVKK
ncbi:MAG: hypothetical protein JSU03_04470 [Bacteroidetes bacterium]|nr:hypothetical protein [Bacteroidota bacterium]MBS1756510.1 hypothetical protein [Bacteroidota bacterium]